METWFWILGWALSFLAIIGNGFTIFLVCSRRNLRTKTNAFIVSLAVEDFCVGLSVIPSLFFCDFTNTCDWPQHLGSWVNIISWLFSNTSVVNLCVLVLDRFIAIVHPLKYITLMTRRRITQSIFFSWVLAVSYNALQDILCIVLYQNKTCPFVIWLNIIVFEILPCVILILCFVSMIFHVCRHDQSALILAKQLRFNHQVSFKTHHEKSAVIMMGLVIGVFLVCYGMHLCCGFLLLSSSPCDDESYKIPVLVLNSAINPLAYACFKRDIKKEFKRVVGAVF
ncbi:octopamine receptor beta-2R-like [Porites lutea]|uniref:octopamine receptor beta-2R-like n=1 Tax=Porites lutea TaxID=51062 RepID=UPI003CC586B2